jgi:hypothetical protein
MESSLLRQSGRTEGGTDNIELSEYEIGLPKTQTHSKTRTPRALVAAAADGAAAGQKLPKTALEKLAKAREKAAAKVTWAPCIRAFLWCFCKNEFLARWGEGEGGPGSTVVFFLRLQV